MKKKVMHPGELLADELKARGLRPMDLCRISPIKLPRLHAVIEGSMGIDHVMAKQLQYLLGIDWKFWLHMQAEWDTNRK